jgi:hypothetical protein
MRPISYARHQFSAELIRHATWLYLRFTLSYRDVEELLAERGIETSYETVRRWVLKFGPVFVTWRGPLRMTRDPDTQARAQQCRKAGPFHIIIPQGGPLLSGQAILANTLSGVPRGGLEYLDRSCECQHVQLPLPSTRARPITSTPRQKVR